MNSKWLEYSMMIVLLGFVLAMKPSDCYVLMHPIRSLKALLFLTSLTGVIVFGSMIVAFTPLSWTVKEDSQSKIEIEIMKQNAKEGMSLFLLWSNCKDKINCKCNVKR